MLLNKAFSNTQFCYWLQGYFEIDLHGKLDPNRVTLINERLQQIAEPFGPFTQWLQEVCDYIHSQDYRQNLIDYFKPIIEKSLNSVFYHVIDNSYDPKHDKEELLDIHDGLKQSNHAEAVNDA